MDAKTEPHEAGAGQHDASKFTCTLKVLNQYLRVCFGGNVLKS